LAWRANSQRLPLAHLLGLLAALMNSQIGRAKMIFKITLSVMVLSIASGFNPPFALAQQTKTIGQCHREALVKYPDNKTKEHQDAMARCMAGKKV
jgi:hypothetical protein